MTRRSRAHDKAWRIEWAGARKLLDALGPGNDSGAQGLLDQALTVGGASALPDSMRECWNWETHAKERRSSLDYIRAVDDEYERVRDKALFRNSIWPSALKVRQPMSALANDLERKLEEQLGPLGTAYVLIAAMVSLAATAAVYSGEPPSWPPSPALLQEVTIVLLACVYVGSVRVSMKRAGRAAAHRVARMALSSLDKASNLLTDASIKEALDERSEIGQTLLKEMSGVTASAKLPLRRRVLGEYHLARAWEQLPMHRSPSPCVADFAALAPDSPERDRVDEAQYLAICRELGVATRHFKAAVAGRTDDPLAMVGLAGALDAQAALLGQTDAEVTGLVRDAYILATARDALDYGWALELTRHAWLRPRDAGPLAEIDKRCGNPIPSYRVG